MKHLFALLRIWPVASLLMLVLLARPAAHAQAPAWTQLSTGVPISTGAFSYIQASVPDASGNVYVSGYFYGSVSFSNTVLTSNSTTSTLASDGFVAKWNSNTGTFTWAVAVGGPGTDQAYGLAISNGAVYVTGYFTGATATFGSLVLTNASTGTSSDGFLVKLTDLGTSANIVWAQQVAGAGIETGNTVAVNGNTVYFGGSYTSTSLTFGNTVLNNASIGTTDIFLVKLTDAGTSASFGWALSFGGSGTDEVHALALSGSTIYLVGDFTSPTLRLGTTVLTNAIAGTTTDIFIAKITDAGASASVAWAQRAGGIGPDTGDAIALNGASLYVAGSFGSATATVGAITLTNASSTGNTADVFVAKLIDAGTSATVTWAQTGGGIGFDRPRAVAVRGTNVYVAGGYGYPTATFGTTTLTNRGTGLFADIFVAKLTDGGTGAAFAWAQSAGSTDGESAYSLALTGNLVVASGGAAVQAAFGPFTVPAGSTTTAAFVASILDVNLTATASPLSGAAFTLYPNPAHTTTTVQLPALPGSSTATFTLLDALGRRVKTETVPVPATGLRHELNIANLSAGLYVLQVQTGAATATRKLVVE